MSPTPTAEESKVIQAFLRAQSEYEVAERALEAHFRPLVEKALLEEGVEPAKVILSRCPSDSVGWAFMQDTIRQASLGHFPKKL